MQSADIDKAATILAAAYRGGGRADRLPDDCAPRNAADALAIQARLIHMLGEQAAGWKGGVRRNGELFYGAVVASRLWPSPATVPAARVPLLGVEAEIAFRFDRELPQRAELYGRDEIAAHVSAVVAIEGVDTRFTSYDAAPFLDRAADLMSNGGLVTGTAVSDWQGVNLGALTVVLTVGGREVVRQVGGHASLDPILPAVDLANALTRSGSVPSGAIMTTGTFSGLNYARPGDTVTVEFLGFGRAEIVFTA